MNFDIKNEQLHVVISSLGAELQSIYRTDNDYEYLWQGDPLYWKGRSPILFPIVGALKGSKYLVDGRVYSMPNHGIARINKFKAVKSCDHEISFILSDNEDTRKMYPFSFQLEIVYTLQENILSMKCIISNREEKSMPFAFGLHPGFNLDDKICSSCILIDDEALNSDIMSKEGFFISEFRTFGRQKIQLSESIFENDALVFRYLKSRQAQLKFDSSDRSIIMSWDDNLPILALWAKPNAPFVCIEPWSGYSDFLEDHINNLLDKPGTILLKPKASQEIVASFEFL